MKTTRPLKIKEDEPNVQGDLSKDKSSMTKQKTIKRKASNSLSLNQNF